MQVQLDDVEVVVLLSISLATHAKLEHYLLINQCMSREQTDDT
jgi:hypothetical protein